MNNLPSAKGVAHCKPPSQPSKGKASDRLARRCLESLTNENNTPTKNASSWILLAQQTSELQTPNKHTAINPLVAQACGIPVESKISSKSSQSGYTRLQKKIPVYSKGWEKEPRVSLFWFEEWMVYFEMIWGRTVQRFEDLESKKDGYGVNHSILLDIFDTKLHLIKNAMDNWPTLPTTQ